MFRTSNLYANSRIIFSSVIGQVQTNLCLFDFFYKNADTVKKIKGENLLNSAKS